MAKFPKRGTKKPKAAALRWNSFTKAELIRTVKTLSARQTKLLNRIATLEREREAAVAAVAQDAVNSAMDVRQPLAQLCDDYSAVDDMLEAEAQRTADAAANSQREAQRGGAVREPDLKIDEHGRTVFPWETK